MNLITQHQTTFISQAVSVNTAERRRRDNVVFLEPTKRFQTQHMHSSTPLLFNYTPDTEQPDCRRSGEKEFFIHL